jgi:hypothetical protein
MGFDHRFGHDPFKPLRFQTQPLFRPRKQIRRVSFEFEAATAVDRLSLPILGF